MRESQTHHSRSDAVENSPNWKRTVELRVPRVGQGNPATVFAIKRLLLADQLFSKVRMLEASALPARYFHKRMSTSIERSDIYTKNSEQARKGIVPRAFGVVAKTEIITQDILMHQRDGDPELMVAVQEHPFGAYSKEELHALFPKGVFLYIPDVYPKQSAIDIMLAKGITPLVWNQDAFDELRKVGLNPILVAPVLPLAYHHDGAKGLEKMKQKGVEDYVLIKASGSGLPQAYVDAILPILKERGVRYQIWYSDQVVTESGTEKLAGSFEDQTSSFYANVLAHPPKVLIAYPSEMVQVATTLRQVGTQFLTFPPRGLHEKQNLRYARKTHRGIGTGKIKIEDERNLRRTILHALDGSYPPANVDNMGLGIRSVADVVRERLEEV